MNKLYQIILSEKPSVLIKENEDYIFSLIPDLKKCKGFKQNNPWHIYDVYEHILHVIDGVPNNLNVRLAALFHDVGKPNTYTQDENGIGHFYGHWEKSVEIFNSFAEKYSLDDELKRSVANLIFYHDFNFEKVNQDILKKIKENFSLEEIELLFALKRSDLLAQTSQYHNLLENYDKQEKILKVKSFNEGNTN